MAQPYHSFQNEATAPPPYVVVEQRPRQEYSFPISLNVNIVFVFAILKCIIGFIEVVLGVVNIFTINYFTSVFGFPIWCGLTILINGLFGSILKWRQTKCLIATFFALSIASLALTFMMLIVYSMTLAYYVQGGDESCLYDSYRGFICAWSLSASEQSTGIGLAGFLMFLIVCELGCSIASVALSCRAYSKCCTTCDAYDCCTCLGCCDCDPRPLNAQQNIAHQSSTGVVSARQHDRQFDTASHLPPSTTAQQSSIGLHNNGFVSAPHRDRQYDSAGHMPPPDNAIGANAVNSNIQSCDPMPDNYSNPCSALVNIFLQLPSGPHLISSSNRNADGTTPQNITIQVCPTDGQGGQNEQPQLQGGMNQASSNQMFDSLRL